MRRICHVFLLRWYPHSLLYPQILDLGGCLMPPTSLCNLILQRALASTWSLKRSRGRWKKPFGVLWLRAQDCATLRRAITCLRSSTFECNCPSLSRRPSVWQQSTEVHLAFCKVQENRVVTMVCVDLVLGQFAVLLLRCLDQYLCVCSMCCRLKPSSNQVTVLPRFYPAFLGSTSSRITIQFNCHSTTGCCKIPPSRQQQSRQLVSQPSMSPTDRLQETSSTSFNSVNPRRSTVLRRRSCHHWGSSRVPRL